MPRTQLLLSLSALESVDLGAVAGSTVFIFASHVPAIAAALRHRRRVSFCGHLCQR